MTTFNTTIPKGTQVLATVFQADPTPTPKKSEMPQAPETAGSETSEEVGVSLGRFHPM